MHCKEIYKFTKNFLRNSESNIFCNVNTPNIQKDSKDFWNKQKGLYVLQCVEADESGVLYVTRHNYNWEFEELLSKS